MRRFAAVLPFACLAIAIATACAPQLRVGALDHVEAASWREGTLEVTSAQGIGALSVVPAPGRPFRICFRYDATRPYTRIEGIDVAAVGHGGDRASVAAVVAGGCATVAAAPGAASLRVQFVDYYR